MLFWIMQESRPIVPILAGVVFVIRVGCSDTKSAGYNTLNQCC
jgi:hypothetical protein